jgi:hypothetical protein
MQLFSVAVRSNNSIGRRLLSVGRVNRETQVLVNPGKVNPQVELSGARANLSSGTHDC